MTMDVLSPNQKTQLPFDQYQRYRSMETALIPFRNIKKSLRILDVGGYLQGGDQEKFTPISLFLPDDDLTVLDVKYNGPGNYVVGSGSELPFIDGAYDVVVSMDTLEHIPQENRKAFIAEMCRTCRLGIILICPVHHPLTVLSEELLNKLIFQLFERVHPALAEHIAYGLPREDDITSWISSSGFSGISYAEGFLPNWLFMMIIKHLTMKRSDNLQPMLDYFYNATIGMDDRREPAYRRVFVYSKESNQPDLKSLINYKPSDSQVTESYGLQFTNLWFIQEIQTLNSKLNDFFLKNPSWMELFDIAEERMKIIIHKDEIINQQLQFLSERDDLIRKSEVDVRDKIRAIEILHEEISRLKSEMSSQERMLNELAQFRERVQNSRFYRLYKIFKRG